MKEGKCGAALNPDKGIEESRKKLLQHLRREIKDERVLQAMERVPREFFVPQSSFYLAYEDIPLPIGWGQTISQPYIIALMTQALQLQGSEKVLELGTGSGYQAAILAELARWVVTVERVNPLIKSAEKTLQSLGYTNIQIHPAEEKLGWPKAAPYDGIIVTAGAPKIPQELLDQLNEDGKMVIPVGSRYEQDLLKVVKKGGKAEMESLGPCRFVPLIGEGAWPEVESTEQI